MNRPLYFFYKLTARLIHYLNTRVTNSGRLFLAMAMAAFFFGINIEGSMFFQFFPLLFLLLLCGFLLSIRLKISLQCSRHLPETCIAGQKLSYSLTIRNRADKEAAGIFFKEWIKRPTLQYSAFCQPGSEKNWLKRRFKFQQIKKLLTPVYKLDTPDMELTAIPPACQMEQTIHFTPQQRGSLHFDGYTLFRKDPLGLFKKEIAVATPANILVLPKLYQAPQLQFSGSRKYHQGGLTSAGDHGDSEEFISLREYMPGDPLKHIDWKSTAKSENIIVKQYKNEYFSRYGMVLDTFCTENNLHLFEESVSVAASILMAQDLGENVLDLLFVGDKCYTETVGKGISEQLHMLKILSSVQPTLKDRFTDLFNLVKGHSDLLSGVVLLFSSMDKERKKLLDFITAARIPCKVILLCEDREEQEEQLHSLDINLPIHIMEEAEITQRLMSL